MGWVRDIYILECKFYTNAFYSKLLFYPCAYAGESGATSLKLQCNGDASKRLSDIDLYFNDALYVNYNEDFCCDLYVVIYIKLILMRIGDRKVTGKLVDVFLSL